MWQATMPCKFGTTHFKSTKNIDVTLGKRLPGVGLTPALACPNLS
jgi:hypothetical protein